MAFLIRVRRESSVIVVKGTRAASVQSKAFEIEFLRFFCCCRVTAPKKPPLSSKVLSPCFSRSPSAAKRPELESGREYAMCIYIENKKIRYLKPPKQHGSINEEAGPKNRFSPSTFLSLSLRLILIIFFSMSSEEEEEEEEG